MTEKFPCIYILTNKRNGTLYVGVTSYLPKRLYEHQTNAVSGFTKKYQLHHLVYYEQHESMPAAIAREKQIKGGSRKKKLQLIESYNPEWRDLGGEVL